MRRLLCVAALSVSAACAAEEWQWWVEPCTPNVARRTGCRAGDVQLGQWALEAWARESQGAVTLKAARTQAEARVQIRWAGGADGLYGEAQPIEVNGKRGALIYVLPDLAGLGRDIAEEGRKDPLFRETVVYLTCLHETGHGFGLQHTGKFEDIMYTFQYGGDFVEYFRRYRRLLKRREDIAKNGGMSAGDKATFLRVTATGY